MKITSSEIAHLSFDEHQRILYVEIFDHALMTAESMSNHIRIMEELVGNGDYFALIEATKFFSMDSDIWNYSFSREKVNKRIAVAYVTSVLSNRLVINYFKINFNEHKNVQIFGNREVALKWLKQQREQHIAGIGN